MVLEHLSVSPKQDIVASLVLTTVVSYIERIGDYTKNVEELQHLYPKDFSNLNQLDLLKQTADRIIEFFGLTRQAFMEGDEEKALQVMRGHKKIRDNCDEIPQHGYEDEAGSKRVAVTEARLARYLKRISANLKNVATSVVKPYDEIGYTESRKPEDS